MPTSDSIARDSVVPSETIQISKDSLENKVKYGARDSMRFDNINSLIYLYGDAFVDYEGLTLRAEYIEVNIDSNLAYAAAVKDSTGKYQGIPEFQDGPQKFNAIRMKYNFDSKKGMVYEAVTQESDIYVRGTKTKYVSGNDSLGTDDMVFNRNAIFTTCNHPEPHYGVRSLKQKLVPNKLVVVGPSIVEIAGVPTPLILPFAFFPLTKGKRSGLILPRDYEYSEQWGFGLREIGYYIPINDYMDARILGDIYFNGSWGVTGTSNYVKKYKYNGQLLVGTSIRKSEIFNDYRERVQRSYRLIWRHNQNNKANPYHNFSGNINFQVNQFDQLNNNQAQNVLNNTIRSTVTYRRIFPEKPFTLTMALNHSQNNNTRDVSISFPDLKFNVRRIQPFKSKSRTIAEKKWYDEVGVTYNFAAKSRYQTKDTLLFNEFDINKLDYGARHDIGVSANYNVFEYLLFNSSLDYDEIWHFRRLNRGLTNEEVYRLDTVDYDLDSMPVTEIDTTHGVPFRDTIQGFTPFRTFNFNTGFSTKLFGTARFKKGYLRGLRHVMTPSVSFQYSPNMRSPDLEYWRSVNTDLRDEFNDPEEYSIFLANAIGVPNLSEERLALNFRLENNFEAKVFNRKDSVEQKVKLLDKISLWSDYNIARDSLKWGMVNMSTFTRIFNGMTTVRFGARWDPYAVRYNEDGRAERIEEFAWNQSRRPLRFERMDVNVATIFTVRQIVNLLTGKRSPKGGNKTPSPNMEGTTPPGDNEAPQPQSKRKEQSLLDIFANFRVSHTFNFALTAAEAGDTLMVSNHFINLRGNLQISPNWSITLGNIGYNFVQKRIQYPDVGFSRDLHCWTLDFRWQPTRGTYSMFIGVKPGSMDFLKVPYRKNNIDTFF